MAVFGRTCLVLGGARSGKSRFAEELVSRRSGPLVYLATAQARDEEMTRRIADHRARRGDRWATREVPIDLAPALAAEDEGSILLVDCLTLWLANLMEHEADLDAAAEELCRVLTRTARPVVLVSNEVGLGLVPATPLGRRFRDAAGRLNQQVAAVVDDVFFVAAGLPLRLKPRDE
ncbi:MAG: bifunctional adenosylcobinamide kinase/adenosylcobinamide-phosphate guanylyltransferase [Geminicoccaceae bacterium]|nr:bifunctional adenosylcobinamide kinase/adenosylcobinamide-phosphate guanylyltransferase [Geminicoccaceae bacterium]